MEGGQGGRKGEQGWAVCRGPEMGIWGRWWASVQPLLLIGEASVHHQGAGQLPAPETGLSEEVRQPLPAG